MHASPARKALPERPRPSGNAGSVEIRVCHALSEVGPAAATISKKSLSGLAIAHRGAVYLDITTHGKQAHTTARHLGVNAIERMVPVIGAVNRLEETLPYQPHPLLPGGPIVNIGTIHGGTKHNQVPDRCTISVDIRLLPSQDAAAVRDFVQRAVDDDERCAGLLR